MIRVLQGDCRDVLPTLDAGSVHCVVTSPPYYGLRDYGVAGQLGLEASPDEYIATMVAVFREVRRVMRDDATLWLNMGDSYASSGSGSWGSSQRSTLTTGSKNGAWAPGNTIGTTPAKNIGNAKPKDLLMMPARLALALQADGWWLRSDIIWHKPNPMPESVTDRPTSAHEHVFLLTKQSRYFYDADAVREAASENTHAGYASHGAKTLANADAFGVKPSKFDGYRPPYRSLRNVWTIATAPYSEAHFATFPPALAKRCIEAGTSERGCCAACGAPWVRQLSASSGGKRSWHDHSADASAGMRQCKHGQKSWDDYNPPSTTGWAPQCRCDAPTKPCTVLDPFAGAGTALLVADRLQRDAIGIELSPAYCTMLRSRVIADAPLLTQVAAQ